MLRTRFCERFGIDAPIVVAPMGPDLTGVELVAAVCRAGGFGILQAQLDPPAHLREEIRRLRALTSSPFVPACLQAGAAKAVERERNPFANLRGAFDATLNFATWDDEAN